MTAILRDALRASLEDVVEEINPLSDHIETELDEVLMEVEDKGDDVEQADRVIDELETAETSMEEIVATLEAHVAEGGMSPQTAATHRVAMANALRRLPINPEYYTISTESFGGTGDKLTASQEALEGAKEVLMKIYNAIKNAIMRAFEAVRNFVQSLTNSGPKIAAAGKKLTADAQAATGKTASEKEMSAGGAAKILGTGGSFDGNAGKALDDIEAGYNYAVVDYSNKMVKLMSPLISLVQSGNVQPARLREAATKVNVDLINVGFGAKGKIGSEGKELPGGRTFVFKAGEGSDPLTRMAGTSVSMVTKKTESGSADAKVAVPAINDIVGIGRRVADIGGIISKYNSTFKTVEKGITDLVKAGNKLASQGNTLNKEEVAEAKAVLGKLGKAASLLRGVGPQYVSYMGTAAKAALQFGNAALRMYNTGTGAGAPKNEVGNSAAAGAYNAKKKGGAASK